MDEFLSRWYDHCVALTLVHLPDGQWAWRNRLTNEWTITPDPLTSIAAAQAALPPLQRQTTRQAAEDLLKELGL